MQKTKKTKKVESVTLDDFVTLGSILDEEVDFISVGCLPADLAMGGGFARKRMAQVYGPESSFKTGLVLSAASQFQIKFENGYVVYDDAEGSLHAKWGSKAFRLDNDRTIMLRVEDGRASSTVEEFVESVNKHAVWALANQAPLLYILDSFDPLGTMRTKAEVGESLDVKESMKDTLDVAHIIRQKIRKIIQLLITTDTTLLIVSHATMKIGVMFGDKLDTTGGTAIKFYSSQRPRLSQAGKIENKQGRFIGVNLKLFMKKNKVARPFRSATFPFYFESGIDDMEACVDFLRENSKEVGTGKSWLCPGTENSFNSRDELVDFIYENELIPEIHQSVLDIWETGGF